MARLGVLIKMLALHCLLAFHALGTPGAIAAPHRMQKRDILSDIGNFFDNLEMQVDMTIFQPIANFFTEAVNNLENYVVLPAEKFFMQANTVVVAGLYDIGMLVEDIGHAIESQIISDIVSVENLAQKVANTIASDAQTVFGDIKSEFDNVITPALTQVGQEIGQGLATAGQDIVTGLEVAGQYIEDHPELIAEVLLTVALTAVTIVQPEFAAGDAALIGDIATEAASGVAGEFLGGLASDAVDIGADFVLDDGAEAIVMETDMTLFEQISGSLDQYTGYIDNVGKILNFFNDVNTTLGDVASLAPVTQQTITDIQNAINPLSAASAQIGGAYSNVQNVIDYLNKAGKIVALVARDDHGLEGRAQGTKSPKPTTTSTQHVSSATSSVPRTTTRSATSKTLATSSTASSTARPSATLAAPPSALLTQYVHHHFLNRTKAAKSMVKLNLKKAVRAHLGHTNMTNAAGYMPYVPTALKNKNMTAAVTYPPTASSHRMAISHQIATGKATAYNAKNTTVKIQMDANAPKDVCLGVPKVPCFGNQAGNPYCLHQCASRWYNQMNITPLHY